MYEKRPDGYNQAISPRTDESNSVEVSGVVELGWLNLWCSLRQSRERATDLLFIVEADDWRGVEERDQA